MVAHYDLLNENQRIKKCININFIKDVRNNQKLLNNCIHSRLKLKFNSKSLNNLKDNRLVDIKKSNCKVTKTCIKNYYHLLLSLLLILQLIQQNILKVSCSIHMENIIPSLNLDNIDFANFGNNLEFSGFDSTRVIEKLNPFYNINPDAYLDPPEFIRSRHFIPELHHVITKDNYILTLHRIINPLVPKELRNKLKPILLQHGLFTSSFNFIISADKNLDRPRFNPNDLIRTKPLNSYIKEDDLFSWNSMLESFNDMTFAKLGLTHNSNLKTPHLSDSLAFELANQGYDVWMGNSRGSTYSLNHTKFDYRYDWRYWDFSFNEIGLFDLPATINYILKFRNRKSLAYIGHSQGNLAMFILQSLRPEWANKVKPFIAMAPVAFIPNVYFGLVKLLVKLLSPIITTTNLNKILKGQLLPKNPLTEQALDLVCKPKLTTPICDLMLTLMTGDSLKRTNDSLTAIVAHHIPEGTSVLNILHFAQMIESGEFRTFNFGPKGNLHRYGSIINPYYPIKNIRSPDIAFISGRTDTLSTVSNVAITRSMLSVPLIDDYLIPDLIWGHADYMYAKGAGLLANSRMIGIVDRYRLVP